MRWRSLITIERKEVIDHMAKKMAEERVFPPMHPGRFLELEFLEPLGMTQYALAKALGVDPPRIYKIVAGERDITADTALRLGRYFGTSAQYWLNLQNRYDLEEAEEEVGEEIEREVQPRAASSLA
jgi:addiction module HigA family antidote